MTINLCIRRPPVEIRLTTGNLTVYRFPLRWTTDHTQSSYGLGVLLDPQGEIFDGHAFRSLRDSAGAWIETDDPTRVAGALGLPADEPGIERGPGVVLRERICVRCGHVYFPRDPEAPFCPACKGPWNIARKRKW